MPCGFPEANDAFTPANVQIWSWGLLKAKYRKVNKRLSRPGLPWHFFRHPEELRPRTVYEFQIELQPIFKTFKKGCRIWLKIASDDALYSTLDSSSQYVETPVALENCTVSIFHDAEHPSHLVLPVIPPRSREIRKVGRPLRDAVPGAPRFT
jgi:predicted acyl esterase